jgi:bifunctional pyridoxal-dependent enzyme with beta-cystathionase and maltose regulon repressor activities
VTSAAWLSLPELRRRSSYKWRAFPPGVLPAFVAEMDIQLAAPVARALAAAVADGDTGYAMRDPQLARAAASFQTTRFGWGPDAHAVVLIPDVMAGRSSRPRWCWCSRRTSCTAWLSWRSASAPSCWPTRSTDR